MKSQTFSVNYILLPKYINIYIENLKLFFVNWQKLQKVFVEKEKTNTFIVYNVSDKIRTKYFMNNFCYAVNFLTASKIIRSSRTKICLLVCNRF